MSVYQMNNLRIVDLTKTLDPATETRRCGLRPKLTAMALSTRRISSGQTSLLPLPASPKAPSAPLPLLSPQKLKTAFAGTPLGRLGPVPSWEPGRNRAFKETAYGKCQKYHCRKGPIC